MVSVLKGVGGYVEKLVVLKVYDNKKVSVDMIKNENHFQIF
jgi:hypothetical protein